MLQTKFFQKLSFLVDINFNLAEAYLGFCKTPVITIGDHLYSTYAKFSKKLTFLVPLDTHTYLGVSGGITNGSFSENLTV